MGKREDLDRINRINRIREGGEKRTRKESNKKIYHSLKESE